jgi:acetyltransferase-like isoleucine patch superfamily enzyme
VISTLRRCLSHMLKATEVAGVRGGFSVLQGQYLPSLGQWWGRFWMRWSSPTPIGRLIMKVAILGAPRFCRGQLLSEMSGRAYVEPTARLCRHGLHIERKAYIADHVNISRGPGGGEVVLGNGVHLQSRTVVHTITTGRVTIGEAADIGTGTVLVANSADITIGAGASLGVCCQLIAFNDPPVGAGTPTGSIIIGPGAVLGPGTVVHAGVRIGSGASIERGAVVTESIPDGAIAAGVPARVQPVRKKGGHVRARTEEQRVVWAIGMYQGASPWTLDPLSERINPVLTHHDITDVSARFVADPFMIHRNGQWYLFFEVLNQQSGKGEIGLASSADGINWKYFGIVLSEPFHLSYPYVFEFNGDIFMVPETHKMQAIRLYKAVTFPTHWIFVNTLCTGHPFSDASIFYHDDRWWIVTETGPDYRMDTMRLYWAADLHGAWREHPQSPVIVRDRRQARPAGRVLTLGDQIIRFAQDCSERYGMGVWAYEVVELSTTCYRERPVVNHPVLAGSGEGWNASGMHHIDAHRLQEGVWLACVDGWMVETQ